MRPVLGSAGAALTLLVAGCGTGEPEHLVGQAVSAPNRGAPSIAVVRSTTADKPGFPRYDIVLATPGRRRLRVVAGDSLRKGARPREFGRISWSPGGRRLAFGADLGRDSGFAWDIYTVRADGSSQRRLTRTRDSSEPVWSPDGRTIVFARRGRLPQRESEPFTSTLWAMRPDGSHKRRLTQAAGPVSEAPGPFSPDGSRLLLSRAVFSTSGKVDEALSGLFVRDLRTSRERRLIADGGQAAFSPDGRRIAFVTTRDRNGELNYGDSTNPAGELYVMRADGTHQRRLTHSKDLNEANPSWLPTGKRLAYQRGKQIENAEGMAVLEINPEGTCRRPLLADPRLDIWYNNPAWRPGKPRRGGGRLRC